MKINALLTAVWIIALSINFAFAQTDWQLKKESDGIKVFTKSVANASLDAFKGVGMVQAPLEKILAVLRDGDNYKNWSPDCIISEQKESSASRQVNYSVTEAPFPVDDRDSYVEFTFDSIPQGIKITLKALPDYGPKEEDRVRIPFIDGFWLLEKLGESSTRVTYQVQADPGGSIPAWLANATAVSMPLESIQNLRGEVKR